MPRLLTLAVVLLALGACDHSHTQIVGKWKTDGQANAMIWEFSADGTVIMGESTHGRYSFGDGGRIKIQTPAATFVHHVEFSADRMILREPNGATTSFTKIK